MVALTGSRTHALSLAVQTLSLLVQDGCLSASHSVSIPDSITEEGRGEENKEPQQSLLLLWNLPIQRPSSYLSSVLQPVTEVHLAAVNSCSK